jgi:hypothetical protein
MKRYRTILVELALNRVDYRALVPPLLGVPGQPRREDVDRFHNPNYRPRSGVS